MKIKFLKTNFLKNYDLLNINLNLKYILNKIPESTGVYYFLNSNQDILYIGKSTNMYNRAINHFNPSENKGKKLLNDLMNVDFVETGSELIALLLENQEIKSHKPSYNARQKADQFTHAIDCYINSIVE